jgi:hypothetical protein
MNGTKLAFHGPLVHDGIEDWNALRAWQPRSAKLFNYEYTSFDRMRILYNDLPNTLFTMRDWEMSMQLDRMFSDPVNCGRDHARDWIAWREQGRFGAAAWKNIPGFDNNRTVCLGINEPTMRNELKWGNPDYNQKIDALVRYEVTKLDTLAAAGMRGGAMNYSVGWPDNRGQNTRAYWDNLTPIRDAIVRGGHFLYLHEYFGNGGLDEMLGWWVGRYRQCPWDVPIIFGESGYDKGVYPNWEANPPRGWRGNFSTEQYIAMLRRYDDYIKADPRVHSAQVYLWDYANNEWDSFALRWDRIPFMNYVVSRRNDPDTNTVTVFPTFPAGVIDPLPPTTGGQVPPTQTLDAWLIERGQAAATVPVTPGFALYDRIRAHGYIPNGPERTETFEGVSYTYRSGEHPTNGEKRTYYARTGNWSDVRYVVRQPATVVEPYTPKVITSRRSPIETTSPRTMAWDTVVLHHTGGGLESSLNTLTSPTSGVSVHYVVAENGDIYELAPLNLVTWHAGESMWHGRRTVNLFSVGIEIVNRGDGDDAYEPDQLKSVAWLLRKFKNENSIERANVTTHKAVAVPQGRKVDPVGLNIEALLNSVYPL